jgi:hypothetical protein
MADIVNLKRRRKPKARADADKEAAANRLSHGRSKAERNLARAKEDAARRKLEGHRREPDEQ